MYIASVVRNNMEDFHVENLTDAQMKELNPIIRDAIYTALVAAKNLDDEDARKWVNLYSQLIPDYWENPTLISDYKFCVRRAKKCLQNTSS